MATNSRAESVLAEHRAAYIEVQKSEARYRNIFESAAVALWEINFTPAKQRIEELQREGMTDFSAYMVEHPEFIREAMDLTIAVDLNQAAIRMLDGRSKKDFLGPVGKVWPPEAEVKFGQTMIAALARKPTFELEMVMRTLSGRIIDVLYSVSYPPEAHSLECIFVAFQETTALNQARVALQKSQMELALATRLASLGQLTASIAHEINQPLAGILSNGQAGIRWLKRDQPNVKGAVASFVAVVEEAKRASAVIEGIRALARNEPSEPVDLCLNLLIEDTLSLLTSELGRSHIKVKKKLDTEMVLVRADTIQVQQVLINLILNATQALMHVDAYDRLLAVESRVEKREVIVSVIDTGPGVAPALRGRLFEAFVTDKEQGMGLGLSLCASIVARHGGRIWPEFGEKPGGIFRFSLPISPTLGAEDM